MNRIGMIVDVAHLSDAGYRDVLDTVTAPIINSHTTCATLCDHPRNPSDEQIKQLAERGGVKGMTFVSRFVDATHPTFDRFIDLIDHAAQLVGPRHVAIFFDFDGGSTLVKDADVFPSITSALLDSWLLGGRSSSHRWRELHACVRTGLALLTDARPIRNGPQSGLMSNS
jgi:microsomal dipeptidase-like Zn-dependent dipeptidase